MTELGAIDLPSPSIAYFTFYIEENTKRNKAFYLDHEDSQPDRQTGK